MGAVNAVGEPLYSFTTDSNSSSGFGMTGDTITTVYPSTTDNTYYWYPYWYPYPHPYTYPVSFTYTFPSKTPHICPVCEGKRKIKKEFYHEERKREGKEEKLLRKCKTCKGTGIVWG